MIALASLRKGALAVAGAIVALTPVTLFALGAPEMIVRQKNRLFSPTEITIAAGTSVRFDNDDPFLHQLYVSSPSFSFDSDEQAQGQSIHVRFPTAGDFRVLCGIHPKMALTVHVR
jgi:plastocyanin